MTKEMDRIAIDTTWDRSLFRLKGEDYAIAVLAEKARDKATARGQDLGALLESGFTYDQEALTVEIVGVWRTSWAHVPADLVPALEPEVATPPND